LPFKILIEADRIVFKAVQLSRHMGTLFFLKAEAHTQDVGCEKDQPASCVAFNSTILIAVWTM